MSYTTTELLERVRTEAMLPDNDAFLTDARVLVMATKALRTEVFNVFRDARAEYWVRLSDIAIVSGQSAYDVPVAAAGMAARDVSLLDSAGNETPLAQIDAEDAWMYNGASGWGGWNGGRYSSQAKPLFYMQDEQIILVDTPTDTTYTLRVRIYERPPKLVVATAGRQVSSIASAIVTLASTPPTSWVTGITVDIRNDGLHFKRLVDSDVTTLVSGSDVTLSTTPVGVVADQWMTLEDESVVVPIPPVAEDYLDLCVVSRCMRAKVDKDAYQLAEIAKGVARKDLLRILKPRIQGAKELFIDRNSPLRRGRR